MADKEQVRPLAPAAVRPSSDYEEAAAAASAASRVKQIRRQKRIKCWGFIAAVILIPAITIVVLIFTVFRIKDPDIRLNGVTVSQLQLISGTIPRPGVNISLIADVSVKNPNAASFKYDNTTTGIYYHGEEVGEARGPPGRARAGRTVRMNISVDIITDRLLARSELVPDLGSGLLTMTSYSKVGGRVNMLRIVKRHVTVKMNCTITVNVTSRALHEQKCKRKVDL